MALSFLTTFSILNKEQNVVYENNWNKRRSDDLLYRHWIHGGNLLSFTFPLKTIQIVHILIRSRREWTHRHSILVKLLLRKIYSVLNYYSDTYVNIMYCIQISVYVVHSSESSNTLITEALEFGI